MVTDLMYNSSSLLLTLGHRSLTIKTRIFPAAANLRKVRFDMLSTSAPSSKVSKSQNIKSYEFAANSILRC